VLATSASIAYAMTVAVAIGPSAGNSPTTITVAQAPANGSATSDLAQVPLGDPAVDPPAGTLVVVSTGTPGSIGPFAGDKACATSGRMLYVGLNTWIPAEPSVASCQDDGP